MADDDKNDGQRNANNTRRCSGRLKLQYLFHRLLEEKVGLEQLTNIAN